MENALSVNCGTRGAPWYKVNIRLALASLLEDFYLGTKLGTKLCDGGERGR